MPENKFQSLAELSGVSVATVSRVLNNHPNVSDKARKKVLDAARKINYQSRQTARGDTIGIIMPSSGKQLIFDYYTVNMLASLTKYIIMNDLKFEIIPVDLFNESCLLTLRGLITLLYSEINSGLNKEILERSANFPVISLNYRSPKACSVYFDFEQGIRLAVEYLARKGHRRVGIINGELDVPEVHEFRKTVKRLKLDRNNNLLQSSAGLTIAETVLRLLDAGPTAAIIEGEECVLPLMQALNQLKIRVPEDLSVISFENRNISQYLNPPHTTLSVDRDYVARTAVNIMTDILREKKRKPVNIAVPHTIIERYSVKEIKD